MLSREDSNQPALGRTHHMHGTAAREPVVWIIAGGLVVFLTGVFLVVLSFWSTPTSSSQTPGLVLIALGIFVVGAVPHVVETVGFPWPATFRRTTERRFKHPRLVGLAEVWFCAVAVGWVMVVLFLQPTDPLLRITFAAPLVGLLPLYAVGLFDRRR